MTVYSYYSIFEPIDEVGQEGKFFVTFPDLDNVFTEGDDFADAYAMGKDVLLTMLAFNEDDGIDFNKPSAPSEITMPTGSSLVYIEIDTDELKEK